MMKEHSWRGQQKIANLIKQVVAKDLKDPHSKLLFQIMANWYYIIGGELAAYTTPKHLRLPLQKKSNGVLTILLANPGFSLEIQASELFITQKISSFFGYQLVSKIKVEIGCLPYRREEALIMPKINISQQQQQAMATTLNSLDDEELRQKLADIAGSLFELTS